MAEIRISVYFKHDDSGIQKGLMKLFEMSGDGNDDTFRQSFADLASKISPEKGEAIAGSFLTDMGKKLLEGFYFEDVTDQHGFGCATTTCGGNGDQFAGRIVRFLNRLCPGVQAQAWGMGDDDPWEFWFKHENGRLVRHEDEPFNGYDARIRGTIYRWWHADLPAGIREGMLSSDEYGEENDDDGDDSPVSEQEYRDWLSRQSDPEGSDFEDQVEGILADEIVGAFTNALADMFGGGAKRKNVSTDAFEATELTEEIVRSVLADIDAHEKRFDVDGIMKHMSKDLKGTVTSSVTGPMPLSNSLYRMTLKMILDTDAEYESVQEIEDIELVDGTAVAKMASETTYVDPMTDKKMTTVTEEQYVLEIVDGRVQITNIDSKEVSSKAR